ncbi:acidic fibroblast growth factor intracellular-binding protein isoform X2 [Ornithorhynchus anatinus]|uniref:acidic fibroblast growth factor intracellular-binding protein isoform X2 n=1 Tax=Ornithorhynchus anatinus TaxID=9258 RepID=UPI0019D469A6|nr:acidic fibroblast growth factor intracellular-binding protein isoform X2 [Ornithorhynchus anatinus]
MSTASGWTGTRCRTPWGCGCGPGSWSRRGPRPESCRATPWTTTGPSTCWNASFTPRPSCSTSSSSRSRPPARPCSSRGTMLSTRPLCEKSWGRSCPRVPRKTWTTSVQRRASPSRAAAGSLTTSSASSKSWRRCGAPWWITSSSIFSSPTGSPDSLVDDMDVDLDKEFLQDLKDLKVLVTDKDLLDLHKSLVCTTLRGKLSVFTEMETNFKNLSRGLVNIASKLTHTKDVRDLFVDLVEKFVEPCRSDRWPLADVRLFLIQYSASVHSLDGFRHQALWDRYMGTLRSCLLRLYHE